jgi:hypothetical protein
MPRPFTDNDAEFLIERVFALKLQQVLLSKAEIAKLLFPGEDFRIKSVYGRGAYGIVLQVEPLRNAPVPPGLYALKAFHWDIHARALAEIRHQERFAQYNMAPRVHLNYVKTATVYGRPVQFAWILMDPIYETLQDALQRVPVDRLKDGLRCLVQKKFLLDYPQPILHADMHFQNLVVLQDGKTLGFIDFGQAQPCAAYAQLLDCIPLIGSLKDWYKNELLHGVSEARKDALYDLIHSIADLYNTLFHVQLDLTRFDTLKPSKGGGYVYKTKSEGVFHSYKHSKVHPPFPPKSAVSRAFPGFTLPRVTE